MSEWKIDALSNHTVLITKGTTPTTLGKSFVDTGINFVKVESILESGTFLKKSFQKIDEETHTLLMRSQLQNNDILFSIAGAIGRIASVSSDILPANINQALAIIRLRTNSSLVQEYLYYYLKSTAVSKQIKQISVQLAQANFSLGDLAKLSVNYPNEKQEQQKIARILSTVDAVIEKTEEAIAKYKAIKAGMMHDLFTRGINENGQLRPSYQQAPHSYKPSKLGWIPKEWEAVRIDEIASMKSGDGITSKSIFDFEKYPVYGGNGLRGFASTYTHDGDFILIGRQGALCGNINRVSGKFYASEHAVVVSVFEQISVDWLSQLLGIMNLNQYSEASAQPGLAVSRILKLFVKKPKYEEQKIIARNLLQTELKIQTEQTALNKYQKLKQGLMQDLLTGKITVSV